VATCHNNLAVNYRHAGDMSKLETALKEAISINEALVKAHPERSDYVPDLARNYHNMGLVQLETGEPSRALDWFNRSIATGGGLLIREPRHAAIRMILGHAYQCRAGALDRLGRRAEAVADWGRAVELDDESASDESRLNRALLLARSGDHTRAAAQAEELADSKSVPPGLHDYNLACVFALASGAALEDSHLDAPTRAARAEALGTRAMQSLRRCQNTGFLRDPTQVAHVREDPDFATLQTRRDFQLFLLDLTFPLDPFEAARGTHSR
jgi:tetratricopeptide (TPR) repeat protein